MSYKSRSRAYSKQGQQIGDLQLTVTHDHETKAANNACMHGTLAGYVYD